MSIRRGLPETAGVRHSSHYVESMCAPVPEAIGQLIPIAEIRPNADQPRSNLGDLSGLKRSIEEKGIIEPLVVRQRDGGYQIISGERRYAAAMEIGLEQVPCVIRESDDLDTLEVALIENLQRKDLTPFEEAEGLKQLAERYGYSHGDIAEKIGKSRTSVTETLSLTRIPQSIRDLCAGHKLTAKSMLLQIARQDTDEDMMRLAKSMISRGISRDEARAARPHMASERPKPMTFRHKAEDKSYTVTVRFKKTDASREEMIAALERALDELRNEGDVGTPTRDSQL